MNFASLATEIEERYHRYLQTTFFFRDPKLRASFERALRAGRLCKGPFLEVTPAYRRGMTPRELFPALAGTAMELGLFLAMDGDRPLYAHQEEAIRRVSAGRNIVVATGTGSGKTECFLYPILSELNREFVQGTLTERPGVRALVLYPMNALAYDQRERLGRLHARLEECGAAFKFSFGQYTGATPENKTDTYRHASDVLAQRHSGELVFRDEMRVDPPHILLTNFSMLEYQLLRPADSPLFDPPHGQRWTFIILDEAHQYRGTRGAEMGLLLRRLKQRLRESGNRGPIRCVATSASLAKGGDDRAAVASFAADLFDETFEAEDVILASIEDVRPATPAQLPAPVYAGICEAIDRNDLALLREIENSGSGSTHSADTLSVPQRAGVLLAGDRRSKELRELVAERPLEVSAIADRLFPEVEPEGRIAALVALADALSRAEQPHSSGPFLSVRYHQFVRALEGAFVQYEPEESITLTPKGGEEGVSFELALCRECGQHYLVGKRTSRHLVEAVRDPSRDDFGVSFYLPVSADDDVTGDEEEAGSVAKSKARFNLCTNCASMWRAGSAPSCDHGSHVVVEEQPAAGSRADQMQQCPKCGYRGTDPVREVIHGGDGPNAMIATTLFERSDQDTKKILAFADSRQEAAYFAWYLDDTYRSILRRSILYRSLTAEWAKNKDPLSLADLADAYRRLSAQEGLFDEAATAGGHRRSAWEDVYREFLTQETRLSLAGVGLLRWSVKWPAAFDAPAVFMDEPWSLEAGDALLLTFMLLDRLRLDKAVELDTRGDVELEWPSLGLFGTQRVTRLGPPRRQISVASWDGPKGWRAHFLAKILERKGLDYRSALVRSEQTLRSLWDHLTSSSDRQAVDAQLLRRVGNGRRLNPAWWRVIPVEEDELIFRCNTCNRIETVALQDICPRRGCQGRLLPAEVLALGDHHYRSLYKASGRGVMNVEEHTAQLTTERGREVQRAFQEGQIHVLSCSTTFELGVDLGDLNTVFLRNVPPEPFNYAQRIGRSGRRSGSPGFAVTYCRRGPHDLYHFSDPTRVLSGRTKPPSVSLGNHRIAERHLVAIVLSGFFRSNPERFKSVSHLIGSWSSSTTMAVVKSYLDVAARYLEKGIGATFPEPVRAPLGIEDGSWMNLVAGPESRLARAILEVASDFRQADEIERASRDAGHYSQAQWAQRRKRTIADEDVLSFLSRKAVIPKYGFPVDVVELDTQRTGTRQGHSVSLARDLAIAIGEFAPTATLVAGKREWQSYGLKKVPEKEWDRRYYRICHRHNIMVTWGEGQPAKDLPCGDSAIARQYLIPIFGFVTFTKPPRPPTHRPERLFTTRPYFLFAERPDRGELPVQGTNELLATIRKAIPGRMAVLSEGRQGRQFWICKSCGAGFIDPRTAHSTPWGSNCGGTLTRLSLGHEFVTDVVRIEFHRSPTSDQSAELSGFGVGLATALMEGLAEVVGTPSTDLNVATGWQRSAGVPTVVLYDDVPGGAGLVANIEDPKTFRLSLEAAHRRVDGSCECGDDTSCYGCLRSYRNQYAHTLLKRGPIKGYLEHILVELPKL